MPSTPLTLAAGRLQARWLALPVSVRGPLWMMAAGALFAAMTLLVKILAGQLNSFEIAFFRAAFGLASVLPFALAAGRAAFVTRRPFTHLARGLVGAVAMSATFYSIAHLPLAEATALSFTRPLFVVLLAAAFLGEPVRIRRLAATAVGFLGVLIMLRPQRWFTGEGIELAAVAGLGGAALVAVVIVFVKKLIRTERPVTLLFYFGLISTLGALVPALPDWVWPSWTQLFWLLVMGAVGASAQSLIIRAYMVADATVVSPFDYIRLVFAAIFGFAFFGEVPGSWMLAGAGVIIAATVYIAHREARLGRVSPPVLDQAPLTPQDLAQEHSVHRE
jgi:drug/metabolite transporter (DMT)-like permease